MQNTIRIRILTYRLIACAAVLLATGRMQAASLVVGDTNSGNSTNFTSGTNSYDTIIIGNSNTASNNSITVANTNTLLQATGYGSTAAFFAVGYNGSSNSLIVTNGGRVSGARIFVGGISAMTGYSGNGSNNLLKVDGGNVQLTTYLYVGNIGSANQMLIQNGGIVSVAGTGAIGVSDYIGNQSTSNSVIVRDAGSIWSNNTLDIGGGPGGDGSVDGSWNTLTVSNQGKVISANGYIGLVSASSNNSVLVTGTNSSWSNSGSLYVGNSGSSNALTVSNGAVVSSGNTYLGYYSGANSNIVTVTGSNSVLTNSGYNNIGYSGSFNSLQILNGGLVVDSGAASAYEVIGNSTAAVGNSVLVSGTNSRWTVTPVLDFRGVEGSLVVSNGGTATFSDKLRIGNAAGANSNSVVVSDANSFLSVGTYMTVGGAATRGNSVVVSNGASMTSYGTLIGSGGSNNSMTIAGRSTFSNGVGSLYVGDAAAASNVLTVSGASTATVNGPVYLGNATNSYGNSILVTGSNTFFTNVGVFYVGNYGDSNTLTVSGGASLGVFTRLTIGEQTGASGNSVTVDGAGSLLTIPGVYVGSYGSNSSLNVTGGGTVKSGFTRLGGEGTPNNSVLVSGAGSVLTNSGDIRIGAASGSGSTNNSLTISNGGTVYAANSYVGYSGNNHWATVTGVGSLWSNSGSLAIGGSSTGNVLALNDQGTVMASNIAVAANNTLSGNGTVTTTSGTTISGFFAPSGTNSFTVNGGLTFTSSGNFLWNLFANSVDTTGYTNFTAPVALNGLLSVTNGSSLTVNLSTNITNGAFWSNAQSWTLISGTNLSAGTNFTLAFSGNTNQSFNTNFYFALRTTTNALLLVYALPDLYIGSNTVQQVSTNFTSGTNSYGNTYIGYGFSSGNNLNVSGASTVLTNTENLYLGYQGNGNGLGINNGATVSAVDVLVGSVSNTGNVLTLNNGAKLIASNVTVTGAEPNANGIYGNGTITAPGGVVIDVGGTIKPSGIGTPLTINGPLMITNGGSYTWSINESTTNATTPGQYYTAPLQLNGQLSVSTNSAAYYNLNWGYNVRSVDELWFSTNIVTFAVMTGTNTASIQAATNLVIAYYGSDQFQGFHTTNFFLTASNSTVYLNYTNGQAIWNAPSGEWSNSGNWSNSTPPSLTVNGRIDNGGSATVNTNVTAYNLSVGLYTSGNSLRITNGGNLLVGDPNWNLGGGGSTAIGNTTNSSNNSVLVDGASATWTNVSGLYVGYYGASNSLVITNGGAVANWTGIVGFGSASSNNSVVVTGSNSVLTNSGDFYVGLYGSGNRLLVTNGAKLYNGGANWDADQASGAIIGGYLANSNSVIVTGSNSAWINSSALSIGGQSAGNSLVISDGALMSVAGYISDSRGAAYYQTTIGSAGGQSNSVLVTGTNSTFTNAYGFILGNVANNNTITVTNGGQLLSAGPGDTIGLYGGSGNTLLVSGTNSLYRTTGLLLGSGAGCSGNGMIISNGAIAITPSLTVGGYDSSGNYVTVTGAGSKLYATNGFAVAFHSGSDTLTVANGGSLYGAMSGNDVIGSYGADCTLLITDEGSLYTNNSLLAVGSYGTIRNLFIVSNGATASIGSLQVGSVAASSNSVIVSGTNSVLSVAGTTYLGTRFDAVYNNLIVTNGGRVVMGGNIFLGQGQGSVGNTIQVYGSSTLSSAGNTTIGAGGSTNSALVSGSNALWSNAGSITIGSGSTNNSLVITNAGKVITGAGLVIGSQSNDLSNSVLVTGNASRMESAGTNVIGGSGISNTLTISDGGLVTGSVGIIGNTTNALSNSVLVTGTGSLWSNTGSLTIGSNGSGNILCITNGGSVVNQSNATIGSLSNSSNNSVLVTGSNSLWSNGTYLAVGFSGSSNSLLISNGGKVFSSSGNVGVDSNAINNRAVVTGANSLWSNAFGIYVGYYGSSNSLTISAGGVVLNGGVSAIGSQYRASNNTVQVTGHGSLWSNSGTLYVGAGGANGSTGNTLSLDDHASVNASNIIVASGNTLTGNGTVTTTSGTTISGGTFAPTGTNALTVNGNLTFTNGGIYLWNLFANSTNSPSSGTNYTVPVVLNGDLSVTTDSIFNVNFGADVSSTNAFWNNQQRWNLVTGTNISAGSAFTLSFTGNTNGLRLDYFSLITNNSSLDLLYSLPTYWQTNTQPWTSDASWTGLSVPTNTTTAYIDNGGTSVLWTNGYVHFLIIGSTNGSSGALALTNGGVLNFSDVTIGDYGSGSVTIAGGGAMNGSIITIASQSGSSGTLDLSQGSVSAVTIQVNSNGVISGNGTITASGVMTINGGTFAPSGTNALTINGNLTFTNGGAYLWSLFANTTNNPASGTNYTVPLALNGELTVTTNSVFELNFVGSTDGNNPFWTNSRQWQVIAGNSSLSSGTNFNLAWASPQASAGLSLALFSLSASGNSLYLNYDAGEITNPTVGPGTTDLPSYIATNTVLVITAPTNGTAVLAGSNPGLAGIVLKSGTLDSTNQNSIPTNASVTVYDGNMGFSGPGTNTIGSLFVAGGQLGASNTIVNVQSFVQTGGALSGGTNATYWADNYYFAATNPATVAAALANLGTVAGYRSTAIVTTNSSGDPVAPVVFDNNMSYDGGTVITGGILQLGGSNSTGPVSVQGIITNNGFLNYGFNGNSTTPTNEVVGSGVIGQVGTGTLTIGTNGITGSFTGSFAAANGTLEITTNSALGNSTNYYLANNGTLYASTGVTNITDSIQVTNGTGIIDNASGQTLALNGTLTKSGTVLVLAGGSFDVNAQITGSGPAGSFDSDLVVSNATVTLNSGNNNYVGPTYVEAGSTLSNGIVDALPSNTVLNMGSSSDTGGQTNRYDMASYSQTLAGLSSATNFLSENIVGNSSGSVTLTLSGATNTTYAGIISGDIALIRSGAGAITLTRSNSYTGGTVLSSGGIITRNAHALGSGSVSMTGGTLTVQSQSLQISSLVWNGGVIALPEAGSGVYVVSTGGLTLTGTGSFNLTGASLTQGVATALLGATNIMGFSTNDFSVTGVGAYGLLLSNNILWIELLADPVPTVPAYPNFIIPGLTPNQERVATALNIWASNNPTGDQTNVLSAITNIPSSEWGAAYDQISPRFYQQMSTIAFNLANAQYNELVQRMYGLRVSGTGFSMSGFADNMALLEGQGDGKSVKDPSKDILRPGADTHWGMFVDGNGMFGSANSGNMLPNYNFQSGGITTGLTYQWSESFLTGLYAGYQGAYAKNSGLGTLIDNSVRFGLISTYGTASGKGFYADALLGGGYNNYQICRTIQFGSINRTANSSPGAGELDSMIAAGYNWKKGNWAFGPIGSLQYTYFGVNAFNETGAQSLNLNNQGWNASSMVSSLGANCAYSWQAKKDLMVVPQVNLGWQHEFLQNPYAINSTMSGTPFSNWSATPIRDTLYTGVGVTVEFARKWNTAFFYNAAAGNSDLQSQNFFWSAGVKF